MTIKTLKKEAESGSKVGSD